MIINAAGRTLSELLEDAGRRFFARLSNPAEIGEALREKISFEAPDPSRLLRQWITELHGLARVQHILLKDSRVSISESNGQLRATVEILGELFDPHRHVVRSLGSCEAAKVRQEAGNYAGEIKFNEID